MLVYQYPKCGTCRKALKFLDAEGVAHETRDIVTRPPSKTVLRKALRLSGLPVQRFFNTSGQSYRQGGFKEKLKQLSTDQALDALASDGKLIKRPLVLGDGFVLVGFRESEWRQALGL
jgi:arsenate reductase